ncbi:hypothetical protein GP486_000597 [Trichoglossum hirsutum]|uniref:Uncharacterized protein n=1 Tax=Trichoglossum hirsutum TaxID=265104 RepID=A0A9P8LIH0_9PEZI|nr:hypothetical protein GP486_000597 [Trichoglossum hirsutum]
MFGRLFVIPADPGVMKMTEKMAGKMAEKMAGKMTERAAGKTGDVHFGKVVGKTDRGLEGVGYAIQVGRVKEVVMAAQLAGL